MRHSVQEQLVWFTTLGQRTYGRYEVQRAGGVGSNRHLERVVSGIYTIAAGAVSHSLDHRLGTHNPLLQFLRNPLELPSPLMSWTLPV